MVLLRALAAFALISICFSIEITNLPGAPSANFKQYSGYYTVGNKSNHHLHYWFVESQSSPSTDPLLLWLTGGPGCSGLSALLTEWGPFMVNPDGATLSVNPYAWNQKANILTLEAPAGVGYSYVSSGTVMTGDTQAAEDNWSALVAFFKEFPQYAKNDFYVTGESYGGIYVPTLVQTILDQQNQFNINIKGFAIGNGCVNFEEGTDALVDFLYAHGMVDETEWDRAQTDCCSNDTDDCPFHSFSGANFCAEFVTTTTNMAWSGAINPYNMYSNCAVGSADSIPERYKNDVRMNTGKEVNPEELSSVPCMDESPVTNYLNRPDVRDALAIPSNVGKWAICSNLVSLTYSKQFGDMTSRVQNAINKGLKGMLYSGDVDMACNFLMGQRFSRKLGFPLTSAKKEYTVGGQVGGFHTKYGSLFDFVTVRGAGHMVPTDKPDVAFHLIDSFLNNKNF